MSNIIDTLKGYVSPDLIAQTSSGLGESSGNVSAALSSAFPSILGGLLNKSSDSRAMGGFLDMAKQQGKEGGPSEVSSGLTGSMGGSLLDRGKEFVGSIFGSRSGDVANAIGSSSGVKSSSASSILAMAAPIVMGFFGKKALSGNWGVSNMVDFLKDQKDNIMGAMPSGVGNLLGGKEKLKEGISNASASAHEHAGKSTNWLRFVIYIAIAGFLFFIINRSCTRDARHNEVTPMENTKGGGTKPGMQLKSNVQNISSDFYEVSL